MGFGNRFPAHCLEQGKVSGVVFDQSLRYDRMVGRSSALLMPQVAGAAIVRQVATD